MRDNTDTMPSRQSMSPGRRSVRKFRRGNTSEGGGRGYLAHKQKPWKNHNPQRSAA